MRFVSRKGADLLRRKFKAGNGKALSISKVIEAMQFSATFLISDMEQAILTVISISTGYDDCISLIIS